MLYSSYFNPNSAPALLLYNFVFIFKLQSSLIIVIFLKYKFKKNTV